MNVRVLENTSTEAVRVVTAQGSELTVLPGGKLKNLDVTNLDEIRGKVHVVHVLND